MQGGERPAWEIEDELARQFKITEEERAMPRPSGAGSVWENDVAFALKDLVEHGERGERGKITRVSERTAPDGGKRGVYRVA